MPLNAIEESKRRFANGGELASAVFGGERVSRFEDGYEVPTDTLWKLLSNPQTCREDFRQSDDCVYVFVATPAFLRSVGRQPKHQRRRKELPAEAKV